MKILSVLVVALLIGGVVVVATSNALADHSKGRVRRPLAALAAFLMVLGAVGFFGSVLSAEGGLAWLPMTFEWPMGYASCVISTERGLNVVAHPASGRVQIYDDKWSFLRGWSVDASGGTFKLYPTEDGLIHVITARGQSHYTYNTHGVLVSSEHYSPATYDSFPDPGTRRVVPTALWLWPFTHPLLALPLTAMGMALLGLVKIQGSQDNKG